MSFGALRLQAWVYSLGEGLLGKLLKVGVLLFLTIGLLLAYKIIQFKGLDQREPMELAHLARQIADGKGFTTQYIRPVSLWFFEKNGWDTKEITIRQPETTHPPLYAFMLAQVFKAAKVSYDPPKQLFQTFAPEVWMCVFSEFWFLMAILFFYLTIRRFTDLRVSLVSLLLVILCDPLWKHAISGSSFTFLLFLFTLICYSLVRFQENPEHGSSLFWTFLAALILGFGFLTKYRFLILLLPFLTYLLVFGGPRRLLHAVLLIGVVIAVCAPWIIRNVRLTGLPLGLATYEYIQNTETFPGDSFEKQIKPNLDSFSYKQLRRKWMGNVSYFLQTELKQLGGNYLIFFFLVGLLYGFQSPRMQRLRYFCLFVIGWLLLLLPFVWNTEPKVQSGNLFMLLVPLIFLFGTSFFFILVDRYQLKSVFLFGTASLFILINVTAVIFTLLPPRPPPYRFPPYYPPLIFLTSKLMKNDELMMSDMPWAVSWYGNTPSISLVKGVPEFMEINDYNRKISGIYLTPLTLYRGLMNEVIAGELQGWSPLILRNPPENFPLRVKAPLMELDRDFLFYTDYPRWIQGGG